MRGDTDHGSVDIPEGMDPSDARAAIKLLYGADQTYRSALRDFAIYERDEDLLEALSEMDETRGDWDAEPTESSLPQPPHAHPRVPRRKRLRPTGAIMVSTSDTSSVPETQRKRRSGRITHLHVTGIASVFLPSWDLSCSDLLRLDGLQCLELNGCDSVPCEVFFDLPRLTSLCLIHCQELRDPPSEINSNRTKSSTIETLDIRGGGLWGWEFLSALGKVLPGLSNRLRSLRLSHTPYASCYNYHTAIGHNAAPTIAATTIPTSPPDERGSGNHPRLVQPRAMGFHETMGGLLLEALVALARGIPPENSSKDTPPSTGGGSPLEDLSLSFFNSLIDRDVASLVLDVLPSFSRLTTLHLPHHTISNLGTAAQRIRKLQRDCRNHSERLVGIPGVRRSSSCISWRGSPVSGTKTGDASITTVVASVSRLRRLWLKPTLKHTNKNNNCLPENGREPNQRKDKAGNRIEKDILVPLLSHFPELGCVARSSNHKGYLYSPCPCCGSGTCSGETTTKRSNPDGNASLSSPREEESDRTIEYLLRMNHSGRCLLEGLDGATHPHASGNDDSSASCPLSLWSRVLERAWKIPPPDFCATPWVKRDATAVFHLLREGPVLFHRSIP